MEGGVWLETAYLCLGYGSPPGGGGSSTDIVLSKNGTVRFFDRYENNICAANDINAWKWIPAEFWYLETSGTF